MIVRDSVYTPPGCPSTSINTASCSNGNAFYQVTYRVYLRYTVDSSTSDPCVPLFDNANEGIPVCGHQINGHILTEADSAIEDVKVYLEQYTNDTICNNTTCPRDSTDTNSAGEYLFCACSPCTQFIVTPYKNDDPLNGVSTFDLVLINKHILGLQALGSPYKIIAADANKSNTVTTFDILEFRKLILGIFDSLPANTSWRFIQSNFVFSDTLNPFTSLPFYEVDSVPPSTIDFIGIKIGDVNGNAMPHNRPAERPSTTVVWSVSRARGSQTLTVPVRYTGTEPLEAFQLGLRFDPAALQLIGPSRGDLPATTAGNFGLTKAGQGEIRMLWLPDGSELEQYVLPGSVLFYLSFKLLVPLPDGSLPMWVDDEVLECLAWRPDALEYSLLGGEMPASQEFAFPSSGRTKAAPGLRADCYPNPTASDALFSIHAPQAGSGRIALFDAFGKLIFMRKVELQAGEQNIHAPEVATAPPGVYVWKVFAGGKKISGHLIKQ